MGRVITNTKKFDKIAQEFGLSFLVLFGSQANGLANDKSDYDIGYVSDENIDIDQEHKITQLLKNEFRSSRVDFVNLHQTTPLLAKKALFDGKLIVENKDHSFANEQIRAYHNYVETKPLRNLYG